MNDQQQIEQIKAEIQELILEMVRYALVESTDEYSLNIDFSAHVKSLSITVHTPTKILFSEKALVRYRPFDMWRTKAKDWLRVQRELKKYFAVTVKRFEEQKQVAS